MALAYHSDYVTLDEAISRIYFFPSALLVFPLTVRQGAFNDSEGRTILSLLNCALLLALTTLAMFFFPTDNAGSFPLYLLQIQYAVIASVVSSSVWRLCFSKDSLNQIYSWIRGADRHFASSGAFFDNRIDLNYTYVGLLITAAFYILDLVSFEDGYLRTLFYYWGYLLMHALEWQITGPLQLLCLRFDYLLRLMAEKDFKKIPIGIIYTHLSKGKDLLIDVALKIDSDFSIELLLLCIQSFVQIVVNSFIILNLRKDDGDWKLVMRVIVELFWIAIAVTLIFRITRRTTALQKQSKEFNALLYQLMLDDKTEDISSNKKLRLHIAMNREITFTACGFFTLDYSLIHSMIAAATTYLVILVQFGQHDEGKSTPAATTEAKDPTTPYSTTH